MKFKLFNYISIVCFFISSFTLLFIPLLNFDNGFPSFAYYLAGAFWIFLLSGIVLQIFLLIKTRKMRVCKVLKSLKIIVASVFVVALIMLLFVLAFLRTNSLALPINLFVLLTSIECFSVICRMEKLL